MVDRRWIVKVLNNGKGRVELLPTPGVVECVCGVEGGGCTECLLERM